MHCVFVSSSLLSFTSLLTFSLQLSLLLSNSRPSEARALPRPIAQRQAEPLYRNITIPPSSPYKNTTTTAGDVVPVLKLESTPPPATDPPPQPQPEQPQPKYANTTTTTTPPPASKSEENKKEEATPDSKPDPGAEKKEGGGGSFTDAKSFSATMLQEHNTLRAQHHAAALSWDEKLASAAKEVAGTCVFRHSEGIYGENIASGQLTPAEVCRQWGVDEKPSYGGAFSHESGHFSQMVWKATKRVGCAAVECGGRGYGIQGVFTVCEYDPPGNVKGGFEKNVEAVPGYRR